jgi:hypothetical protein
MHGTWAKQSQFTPPPTGTVGGRQGRRRSPTRANRATSPRCPASGNKPDSSIADCGLCQTNPVPPGRDGARRQTNPICPRRMGRRGPACACCAKQTQLPEAEHRAGVGRCGRREPHYSSIPPFQSDANRAKQTQFPAPPGGTRQFPVCCRRWRFCARNSDRQPWRPDGVPVWADGHENVVLGAMSCVCEIWQSELAPLKCGFGVRASWALGGMNSRGQKRG